VDVVPSGRLQFLISQSLSDGVMLYSSIFLVTMQGILYTFFKKIEPADLFQYIFIATVN